ncbi:hypothetical protein, partial [Sphingobium sp. BHU LFT2]|uniref:hypothetical protein n=1 Tax=Sphingobium sp. BHU LFT2 TaxID=2807634 RepID=UPI001BE624D1
SSGWDRVGHRRYGHQAMKQAHNCGFLIDTVHYSLSLGKVNNKSLCVCMFVYLGWLKTTPSAPWLFPALSLMVGLLSANRAIRTG